MFKGKGKEYLSVDDIFTSFWCQTFYLEIIGAEADH